MRTQVRTVRFNQVMNISASLANVARSGTSILNLTSIQYITNYCNEYYS